MKKLILLTLVVFIIYRFFGLCPELKPAANFSVKMSTSLQNLNATKHGQARDRNLTRKTVCGGQRTIYRDAGTPVLQVKMLKRNVFWCVLKGTGIL